MSFPHKPWNARPGAQEPRPQAQPDALVDRLVDEITNRIKARLGTTHLGAVPLGTAPLGTATPLPLREQPCIEGPGDSCAACGLCAVRRPEAVRAVMEAGAERVGAGPGTLAAPGDIAGLIDHTLLKADATAEEVRKLCEEARQYHFASVCVNSGQVARAKGLLRDSGVMVCAVVGFPLGAMVAGAKAFEAREAVRAGADEIDMVLNQGALKSRDYATVLDDIRKVVEAARPARVKVILETGGLSQEEKIVAITLSKVAGAHFVKTSTGFGPGGATAEDVALMRKLVGSEMGVKASGGIRTCEDAQKMTQAGANRIGASASVAIVNQCRAPGGGTPGKDAGSQGKRAGSDRPAKTGGY